MKSFSLSANFLIVILMREFKTLVPEKHLNNRGQSFSVTTYWKFWSINNLTQGTLSINYSIESFPAEVKFTNEISIGALQPEVLEKIQSY